VVVRVAEAAAAALVVVVVVRAAMRRMNEKNEGAGGRKKRKTIKKNQEEKEDIAMMKLKKRNAENTSLQHLSRNISTMAILLNAVRQLLTQQLTPPPPNNSTHSFNSRLTKSPKYELVIKNLTFISTKQQKVLTSD
jgi:negative regulator of sigma E activity